MANAQLPLLPLNLLIAAQLQMNLVTTMAVGKRPAEDWLLSSGEESANHGNSTGGRFGGAGNKGFKAIIQF